MSQAQAARPAKDLPPALGAEAFLLKGADEHGFSFYTNMDSPKARDLDENPRACLNFWWGVLQEQVRIG